MNGNNIQGLVRAIAQAPGTDRVAPALDPTQWAILGGYMQTMRLAAGQTLIHQGAADRTLYLVESGSLSVHYEDSKGRVRLAIVGPGSAVGEGAFFSSLPRNASVQVAAAALLWTLPAIRFAELGKRHPAIALELAMALGALLAHRFANKPKRVAVT